MHDTVTYILSLLYLGQFRIRTAPHDRFKREGNDLHTTVTITLVIFFIHLPECLTVNPFILQLVIEK